MKLTSVYMIDVWLHIPGVPSELIAHHTSIFQQFITLLFSSQSKNVSFLQYLSHLYQDFSTTFTNTSDVLATMKSCAPTGKPTLVLRLWAVLASNLEKFIQRTHKLTDTSLPFENDFSLMYDMLLLPIRYAI